MERAKEGCGKLVLVTCPFQGHMNPMLQLGEILQSKGFSITIFSQTQSSPSNHPLFTFLPLTHGLPLSNHDSASVDFISLIRALNVNSEGPLKEHLAHMMKQNEEKVNCVIYDSIMYMTEGVANQLNIPSIVLETSCVATWLAFSAFPKLQLEGYIPIQDSMSQDLVPELHPFRFKDLPIFNLPNLESTLELLATVFNIKTSIAVIFNTVKSLEKPSITKLQQHYQAPIFTIGPFHKISPHSSSSCSLHKEDTNCISWLDKQAPKSVLYLSLGSIASIDESGLIEIASGLAKSGQPFLWVIRPGAVRPDSEWLGRFNREIRERGCIVEWAPQKEVLAHFAIGCFLSHCGWNSTIESVSQGVPMICCPCFGDQRLIARLLSHVWRVGLELGSGLERGEIESVIRRIMVGKEGEEMRERAVCLKEKVEISLKESGSSYNSLNDLVDYILSV